MIELSYDEKNYDDILSRFYLIPERYGRTDRQTDRQICYISVAYCMAESTRLTDRQRYLRQAYKHNLYLL